MEAGLPKIELNFFSALVTRSGVFIFKDVFIKETLNQVKQMDGELVDVLAIERIARKRVSREARLVDTS